MVIFLQKYVILYYKIIAEMFRNKVLKVVLYLFMIFQTEKKCFQRVSNLSKL